MTGTQNRVCLQGRSGLRAASVWLVEALSAVMLVAAAAVKMMLGSEEEKAARLVDFGTRAGR